MAVDKLVDSTALDAGLTTVANAIRTKGGTSEQLSFPQGMAEAIAAISGGGLPIGIEAMTTGSFILSEDLGAISSYKSMNIKHDLGVYPKVIFVWTEDISMKISSREEDYYFIACSLIKGQNDYIEASGNVSFFLKTAPSSYPIGAGNDSKYGAGITVSSLSSLLKSEFTINGITYQTLPKWKAGVKYNWVVFA